MAILLLLVFILWHCYYYYLLMKSLRACLARSSNMPHPNCGTPYLCLAAAACWAPKCGTVPCLIQHSLCVPHIQRP
jgi:hypothetical protein